MRASPVFDRNAKEFNTQASGSGSGSTSGDEDDPGNICFTDDKEWYLKSMKVPEAWEYSSKNEAGTPSRGKGIIIGQIDTGYSDHECFTKGGMFNDTAKKGFNTFVGDLGREDVDDPKDTFEIKWWSTFLGMSAGHGTLLGSLAVSGGNIEMKNDNKSPRGSAPDAKLYSIRAVNDPRLVDDDVKRITNSFGKIVDDGIDVHVVTMSFLQPTSRKIHLLQFVTSTPDLQHPSLLVRDPDRLK